MHSLTALTVLWLLTLLGPAAGAPPQESDGSLPFSISGPSFVAILVPDVQEAADWYFATFLLEEARRLESDDGAYSIRLLTGSGLTLELLTVDAARPAASDLAHGLFKVGLYVDDIAAAHAWLRERGTSTDESIFADETLQARSFVFRDPYGNRLQLFETCNGPCESP